MSEQDREEQKQTSSEDESGADQASTGAGANAVNQSNQAQQGSKDSSPTDAEQTGEGTGAKAGEYS